MIEHLHPHRGKRSARVEAAYARVVETLPADVAADIRRLMDQCDTWAEAEAVRSQRVDAWLAIQKSRLRSALARAWYTRDAETQREGRRYLRAVDRGEADE